VLNSSLSFNYETTFKCVERSTGVVAKFISNLFECKLEKSSSSQYIANISLYAVSKGKGNELQISNNFVQFYFMGLNSQINIR
jgi:hypothetical protein